MATKAQNQRDYATLRLLDAVTGKVAEADYPALRADVHAALGVEASGSEGDDDYQSREDVHNERVSADARDALHVDSENTDNDGQPAPAQ